VLDASAQDWETIYINGGHQVRLAPSDACDALGARLAEIAA
jgi:Cys-tRNA(Pro)/Cys-tRNA(Cys) deacylase